MISTTARRRLAALLAAACLAALVTTGTPTLRAAAIVEGERAPGVAPYDGSLQRVDSPRGDHHVCGATLVAPRWAVTAGHCVGRVKTGPSLRGTGRVVIALSGRPVGWKVRFGSRAVGSGGRVAQVEAFVRASRSVDPDGDIALLRLRKPLRGVEPAPLAAHRPTPGTRAVIQGWGYTGRGGLRDYESTRSYPDSLQGATTSIAARSACGLSRGQAALCVGTEDVGPDNMDSGGPVFVVEGGRRVLAGTVNGGNYVSGLRPSVYTDLSAHRRWIDGFVSGRRSIPREPRTTGPGLAGAGTIAPSGCSASVVRTAASLETDPAMVLTNGHCVEPRPRPGRTLVDRPARQFVNLLGADSNPVARAVTTRLLVATMTGTDVAIYRLRQSYARLERLGVPSRLLSSTGPAPGDELVMFAGSRQTTYSCTVEAVVPEVREAGWTQRDAVRYATRRSCLVEAGLSGSPLLDARTGQVVAVHNSHVAGDAAACREDNPCEVADDGSVTAVRGRGYAQQVAGISRCLVAGSRVDPAAAGCVVGD